MVIEPCLSVNPGCTEPGQAYRGTAGEMRLRGRLQKLRTSEISTKNFWLAQNTQPDQLVSDNRE